MTNSFLEDQARARGMTVSEMPRRNPPVLRQCLYCGKDFYAHVCEIKKNKSKTCSRKCSWALRRTYPKKRTFSRKCEYCSKDFSVDAYDVEHGKGRFCSPVCYRIWRKEYHESKITSLGRLPKGFKTTNDIKGYRQLHFWVETHMGKPKLCSACGDDSSNTVYHWANKSGEYKKSLLDWRRLCAGCHKREKKVLV